MTSSALHSGLSLTWRCFPLSDFSYLSSPFSSSPTTYVSPAPGVFLSLFLEMPFSLYAPPLPCAHTPSCVCLENACAAIYPSLTATVVPSALPTASHVCWFVSSPARRDALEFQWVSSSALFLQYLTRLLSNNKITFAFFYLKNFELFIHRGKWNSSVHFHKLKHPFKQPPDPETSTPEAPTPRLAFGLAWLTAALISNTCFWTLTQ